MKIAVPVKEDQSVDQHFGHCDYYQIFTVNDQHEITNVETMESPKGCGCKSDIADRFEAIGVSILLAGGIGDGAINKLAPHGIKVMRNCKGQPRDLVMSFLSGHLLDGGQSCSSHEEGHACNH